MAALGACVVGTPSAPAATKVADRTAPETTITAGPSGPVNTRTPSFSFAANEPATFTCSLDGATFKTCSSPTTTTALADGSHTFAVRARDIAGNVDASPAKRSFRVDTAAPDTKIDSGPASTTTETGASLSFSATETATFRCRLDGGAWEPCTSPRSYAGLAVGAHSFSVYAVDAAGNADASSAIRDWSIEAPPAAPPAPSCLPDYGTFGVDNWPAGCWRPYSDASPFNEPLPANPALDPSSAAIVARLTGFGRPSNIVAGAQDSAADWNHPTYYSTSTDPVFTLHCTSAFGSPEYPTCALEGLEVRIPDDAKPAGGGDAHMTVVDQAAKMEYDLWKVTSKPRGGGTLELGWGGKTAIDGTGLGSDATAARFGNLAGIVRAQELEAGRIDHALFIAVHCDSGAFVYPALKTGASCAASGLPNADAPPMGARLRLNMSDAEIAALPVPAWKKTIFTAMARYGMFVGDTGDDSWIVQVESDSTYTSFGRTAKFLEFAQRSGFEPYFDAAIGRTVQVGSIKDDVDWAGRLEVVAPCVSQRTC